MKLEDGTKTYQANPEGVIHLLEDSRLLERNPRLVLSQVPGSIVPWFE